MEGIDQRCPVCGADVGQWCVDSLKVRSVHAERQPTVDQKLAWHAERVPLTDRLRGASFIPGVHYVTQTEAWMREAADVIERASVREARMSPLDAFARSLGNMDRP